MTGAADRKPDQAALGTVVLAFDGFAVPESIRARLAAAPAAGVTLFRYLNVRDPGQVLDLTTALRAASRDPLLICADQEGGQLIALGEGTTPFAGNMALGAAGDEELAERVGRAVGTELRAMGVNVCFAPVCDLATNPANPALGIRSFGDDPVVAGRLAAATVRGLGSAGVAATAKHFPGLGDLAVDSHHELGVVGQGKPRQRFDYVELVPFRSAIAAGAQLVMSAHVAAPALSGRDDLPATVASAVMSDLLRHSLGFDGLAVTDALDMAAIVGGPDGTPDVIAALLAGVDLLLTGPDEPLRTAIEAVLVDAARSGRLDDGALARTGRRLAELHGWLAGFDQPDLAVVSSAAHRELARELAERSVTLVRNDDALVPLRLPADARVGVVQPAPVDLTPADTSAAVGPTLATAIARRHGSVTSIVTALPPTPAEIAAVRDQAGAFDLLIVGSIGASFDPAQAALVEAIVSTGVPLVTVALRGPWDLTTYPASRTHTCTYGILPPSVEALADALWGLIPFQGRLPVALAGLHGRGHGVSTISAPLPTA
jgi:beta-N-acetylhexosaminidase